MIEHIPVLFPEVLQGLAIKIKPQGIDIDATFGRGGPRCTVRNGTNSKLSPNIHYVIHYVIHLSGSRTPVLIVEPQEHQQIVLTSDRYPKEINNREERLKSRFGWGLTVAIEPPSWKLE